MAKYPWHGKYIKSVSLKKLAEPLVLCSLCQRTGYVVLRSDKCVVANRTIVIRFSGCSDVKHQCPFGGLHCFLDFITSNKLLEFVKIDSET